MVVLAIILLVVIIKWLEKSNGRGRHILSNLFRVCLDFNVEPRPEKIFLISQMAKKKKVENTSRRQSREQELLVFCYENEIHFDQYNTYHFRLFKDGFVVDVWPTSKKFWNSHMGASRVYNDPREIAPFLGIVNVFKN